MPRRCAPHTIHVSVILHAQQAFDTEMQSFFYLFTRYLSERAKSVDLYVIIFRCQVDLFNESRLISDWDRIKSPADDQIVPYDALPQPHDHSNLNKLAVLKVNGGLGTSMGMSYLVPPASFLMDVDRHDWRKERAGSQG
jgi:UDP-N-acetylglucosamine pyrophosphorylase